MIKVLAALAAALALAGVASADTVPNPFPKSWPVSHRLSALASSFSVDRPTTVVCSGQHDRVVSANFAGETFVGEPYVSLSMPTCVGAIKGMPVAVLVLLHEYGHSIGIANEAQANCYGLTWLRWILIKDYHYTHAAANSAWWKVLGFIRAYQWSNYQPWAGSCKVIALSNAARRG